MRIIEEFGVAGSRSSHRIVLTPSVIPCRPERFAWVPRPVWNYVSVILLHLRLLVVIWLRRDSDLILVHSFSTTLIGAMWPLLFPLRDRLAFIVHQNLQYAHVRPLERRIFKFLCRRRFRFAFLESIEGLAELGLDPSSDQFLVLPLAAHKGTPAVAACRAAREGATVGVIGNFRAEKRIDGVLQALLAAREQVDGLEEIVFGCPDQQLLERWTTRGLRTVNTRDYGDYIAALEKCDVVVLDYDCSRYYYRSSGVIADAAALNVAVVAPDFPVFRKQLLEPAPIGAVFHGPEDLLPAIRRAVEIRRSARENFEAWSRARSLERISELLDDFVARTAIERSGSPYPSWI